MKVLFYQNNEKFKAFELYKQGKYFGHTFYGITHLPQYGIDTEIMHNPERSKFEARFKSWFKFDITSIKHTYKIIKLSKNADVVFAPYPSGLPLLVILKLLGVFNKKLAVIIHNYKQNFFYRTFFLRGIDAIICINKLAFESIPATYKQKKHFIEWGPDLDFYAQKTMPCEPLAIQNYFISTGKAGRDFETVLKALKTVNFPALIYLPSDYSVENESANMLIKRYKELLNPVDFLYEYRNALAFIIPLNNNNKLLGLSSLVESMAMKKPVIMTYNQYINFDIEKEGIGLWVDVKDVDGWVKALTYLYENPGVARSMGEKGYKLCETTYNLHLFSQKLAGIIKNLLLNKDA